MLPHQRHDQIAHVPHSLDRPPYGAEQPELGRAPMAVARAKGPFRPGAGLLAQAPAYLKVKPKAASVLIAWGSIGAVAHITNAQSGAASRATSTALTVARATPVRSDLVQRGTSVAQGADRLGLGPLPG